MDEEDENVIEDAPDMADKGFGNIDFTPVVSPTMQEDSGGERMQLCLFVYGVRHHYLENERERERG